MALAHQGRRVLARQVQAMGISDAQCSILDGLNRSGDGVHQHLSVQLGLEGSAVVQVLNDMDGGCDILRVPHREDRRVKDI